MTDDYDIGDIVRVAFGNPLDAIVEATEPAIQKQIEPPTDNELAEIEELARKAAELQDKLKEVQGDMPGNLRKLRDQLKHKMMNHGMTEVNISGRPTIELSSSSSRKATRKSIISVMQDEQLYKLTEEQRRDTKLVKAAMNEGKRRALNLWNKIEPTLSWSLSIPDPAPEEPESPY